MTYNHFKDNETLTDKHGRKERQYMTYYRKLWMKQPLKNKNIPNFFRFIKKQESKGELKYPTPKCVESIHAWAERFDWWGYYAKKCKLELENEDKIISAQYETYNNSFEDNQKFRTLLGLLEENLISIRDDTSLSLREKVTLTNETLKTLGLLKSRNQTDDINVHEFYNTIIANNNLDDKGIEKVKEILKQSGVFPDENTD